MEETEQESGPGHQGESVGCYEDKRRDDDVDSKTAQNGRSSKKPTNQQQH